MAILDLSAYASDTKPFDEHDELADDYYSSVGNIFWRTDMLPEKGLAFVPSSCWLRPSQKVQWKLEVTKR